MNAVLALVASFVMVFFTALVVAGILLGTVAAMSHFVEWIVVPAPGADSPVGHDLAEGSRPDSSRS